jgi:hypothetical protein
MRVPKRDCVSERHQNNETGTHAHEKQKMWEEEI